jgi:hypothetical protein
MPRVGFETAISATKWPQTYALDRAATGIGFESLLSEIKYTFKGIFLVLLNYYVIKTSAKYLLKYNT